MRRFNGCKYMKSCKVINEWQVAKGKHKILVLIAICDILLTKVFTNVKSGLFY